MNDISCPFCSTSQKLPQAAAGQTARCKSCGKTFMVPAAPSAVPTAAHGRPASVTPIKSAVPQASPASRPVPPLGGSRPTPAIVSTGSAYRPAGPGLTVPGGGAAAHAPAVGGGGLPMPVAVPVNTPPPDSVGGTPPSTESAESPGSSFSLLILGGAACLILGGLLLLVVIVRLANRDHPPDRPTAVGTSLARFLADRPLDTGEFTSLGLVQRVARRRD